MAVTAVLYRRTMRWTSSWLRRANWAATGAAGTNPEQLFAAGYSACFLSAMKFIAGQRKQTLPADTQVTADVGIGPNDNGGFALDIDLRVSLPGLAADAAKELVDAAHQVCPYSNATRNNVAVRLQVA